jgi:hypothetical protein
MILVDIAMTLQARQFLQFVVLYRHIVSIIVMGSNKGLKIYQITYNF